MASKKETDNSRVVAQNRRARHDYHIEETYEAGIALTGTEIKSVRAGQVSLGEAYAEPTAKGVVLHNMHISPYEPASRFNHDPKRPRRLLLNAREIESLIGATSRKGLTLIPLKLYIKGKYAKVELGLGRGKGRRDKREAIKERETRRQIDRAMSKSKRRA